MAMVLEAEGGEPSVHNSTCIPNSGAAINQTNQRDACVALGTSLTSATDRKVQM